METVMFEVSCEKDCCPYCGCFTFVKIFDGDICYECKDCNREIYTIEEAEKIKKDYERFE